MEYTVETMIIEGTTVRIRKPILTEECRAERKRELERKMIILYKNILADKERT